MTERQWQEVFSIVRKYQRNMIGNSYYQKEYDNLTTILDQLYPLAYANQTIEDTRLAPKEPR